MSVIQIRETKEGEEISLKCVASGGRPLPIIQWTTPADVEFVPSESSILLVGEGKLSSFKLNSRKMKLSS